MPSKTGYWHIQCIQRLSAAHDSIAAPANPIRMKIPKYITVRSNNLRVSVNGMGHDGHSEGHKGLDCMTFSSLHSSGNPELRTGVGEATEVTTAVLIVSLKCFLSLNLFIVGPDSLPVYDLVRARMNGLEQNANEGYKKMGEVTDGATSGRVIEESSVGVEVVVVVWK